MVIPKQTVPVLGLLVALATVALPQEPGRSTALWVDATDRYYLDTAEWTNRVELADVDGDRMIDLLFANGGDYPEPGTPELNRVFLNRGPKWPLEEATEQILGATPDHARVIKVRDVTGDAYPEIFVGTTFQSQSRMYLGTGRGSYREVTSTHLPQIALSVGDLELGDVDDDGDLDLVLADWGPGSEAARLGGRTRLWLNDGEGRFRDATAERMPETLVRFSQDLELVDVDNDWDLDILLSCTRCGGGIVFVNDGGGRFVEEQEALPGSANCYEIEAMDLDGDGFLDLATVGDRDSGDPEPPRSRRTYLFRNTGDGRFSNHSSQWLPDSADLGGDDTDVAFLDADADGDADLLIGSLSGPDRLLLNDGSGRMTLEAGGFDDGETSGTLALALADLDEDGRLDVVHGRGGSPGATAERIFLGAGLEIDTAAPTVASVVVQRIGARTLVRARVHDRKSPAMPQDLDPPWLRYEGDTGTGSFNMTWVGEYLWRVNLADRPEADYQVCVRDAAHNEACSPRAAF